jgi:hypothetical protein
MASLSRIEEDRSATKQQQRTQVSALSRAVSDDLCTADSPYGYLEDWFLEIPRDFANACVERRFELRFSSAELI